MKPPAAREQIDTGSPTERRSTRKAEKGLELELENLNKKQRLITNGCQGYNFVILNGTWRWDLVKDCTYQMPYANEQELKHCITATIHSIATTAFTTFY
ncbi:hypothetical protein AVEN_138079-1 [Araneus ventricosus]|uniref:Uncharacterized protein n=1 Tax=Araneus ventricosus TaxID=182803 RepID=A0A4Y2J233_ARAVE|nr:hypothetical protein AVEN_138079-1 [Araneus ventricosus]